MGKRRKEASEPPATPIGEICVAAKAGLREDGSVELRFGVDFDQASSTALANLGVISDRVTSSGGYLSLWSTIDSFKADGMTCETNDFGSGAAPEEE